MTTKVFWASLIAGMLMSAPALAVPQYGIRITGPAAYAGGITCFDNAACDGDASIGGMNVSAGSNGMPTIAGFNMILDFLQSNSPGGPSESTLDAGWFFGTFGGGSGTLTIEYSATGYTYPTTGLLSTLLSSIGGSSGSGVQVSGQQYIDLSNTLFGTSGIATSHGPITSSGAWASNSSLQFFSDGEYSITTVLTVTMGPNATSSGNFQARVVPEPATLVLLGIGLLGIGGFVLRRRIKAAKTQQ